MSKKINNLDQYLEKLFSLSRTNILARNKKAKSQKPSEAFTIYLQNRLKTEFSLMNKTKNSILDWSRSRLNWYTFLGLFRQPAFRFASAGFIFLLFLTGIYWYPKLKNRRYLAKIEKSVVNLDQELAFLDQESQEIDKFSETEIEEDLNLIQIIQ